MFEQFKRHNLTSVRTLERSNSGHERSNVRTESLVVLLAGRRGPAQDLLSRKSAARRTPSGRCWDRSIRCAGLAAGTRVVSRGRRARSVPGLWPAAVRPRYILNRFRTTAGEARGTSGCCASGSLSTRCTHTSISASSSACLARLCSLRYLGPVPQSKGPHNVFNFNGPKLASSSDPATRSRMYW